MDPALTYGRLSFWHESLPQPLTPRPPLPGRTDVDVAIVGAGYTGLWTAYYLTAVDPSVRIAVIEQEVAGFGASGRNGGWCSALFPAPLTRMAKLSGRTQAIALQRALQATIDEVGRVAAAEGIDCHYAKAGTITLARTPPQVRRAHAEIAEARSFGFGEADLRLLPADEARAMCGATAVAAATYTPHCAVLHPARLVRGLAAAVERRGVPIYERTPARRLAPGLVDTDHGQVRAAVVVRATEGYTAGLPGLRRTLAPVYSLVLATEPLPAAVWDEIGLGRRETFHDHRRLIIYGQRTADDRLVFGGRGAPYHFASRVLPEFDRDPRVFAELRRALVELFPATRGAAVTHTWGGPLGIPRDFVASVGLARRQGLAWAGGYVGDGVGATNLAGRTLADLITGRDTELVRLPWVGHRSRRWEPEPLRWLGINGLRRFVMWADSGEARNRPRRGSGPAVGA
jgi:glycine/D-amino acid oxidase-like deaminating enzyme